MEMQEDTLKLVAENFRKALEEISVNTKNVDKFALMDMAKKALHENQREVQA